MTVILATNCSNRKTIPIEKRLQAAALPKASLKEIGIVWRTWLKEHPYRLPAENLYSGRGTIEAKLAATAANASHWFVSAGLGLVEATEKVPGYDLTVSGNTPNQIQAKIKGSSFNSQAWWGELAKRTRPHRTFARLIENRKAKLVVLALPSNYLRMVLLDLDNLDTSTLKKKVRIIGPPKSAVPPHLQSLWIPYDTRLDGPDSPFPGTRSDFPQRAARHFLESIWSIAPKASAEKHALIVRKALANFSYPIIPKRKQLSDHEILLLIEANWSRAEGKSGRMLRIFRDEEYIACEQSRFKDLFNHVKRCVI